MDSLYFLMPSECEWTLRHYDVLKLLSLFIIITRVEALRRWKSQHAFRATYGKLLQLCVDASHTLCAEAIFEVLRKKSKEMLDIIMWVIMCFN